MGYGVGIFPHRWPQYAPPKDELGVDICKNLKKPAVIYFTYRNRNSLNKAKFVMKKYLSKTEYYFAITNCYTRG